MCVCVCCVCAMLHNSSLRKQGFPMPFAAAFVLVPAPAGRGQPVLRLAAKRPRHLGRGRPLPPSLHHAGPLLPPRAACHAAPGVPWCMLLCSTRHAGGGSGCNPAGGSKAYVRVCVCVCLCLQAAYDAAPLLPPEGFVRGPCLLGSLSHFVDDFDWSGGWWVLCAWGAAGWNSSQDRRLDLGA